MRLHRSEEHTSELQSLRHLVCRLLLEKKKKKHYLCCTPQQPAAIDRSHHTSMSGPLMSSVRRLCFCRTSGSWPFWTVFFFFNDTATTEIYTLSLHDALPI